MVNYTVIVGGKVFKCTEALLKSDFDDDPSVDVYCDDSKMITDDVFVGTISGVIPNDLDSDEYIENFNNKVKNLVEYKFYIEYNF